jgi:hypothetical protein
MSTFTHSRRASSHRPIVAGVATDPIASGPFPGMSARAALIARTLGVAVLFAWIALTDLRLLVVLASAVPFWIATELDVWRDRRSRASRISEASLLYLRPVAPRPSIPGRGSPPKAA